MIGNGDTILTKPIQLASYPIWVSMGYKDVTNLVGGMFGWQRAGLPIEK
jgi:3-mercaptopyruvate sulfurtransferase SseA